MDSDTLTEFFGWATVINIGFYLLIVVSVFLLRGFMISLNARLFDVDEAFVTREVFKFIAQYKLLMTFFCFVPYLALKLMA